MAYSTKDYTGDGVTTDFLFDKPYIAEAHVKATVNAVETAITFVDPTHVRFAVAPASGVPIILYRESDVTAPTYSFPDPTYLRMENLEGDFLQQLYLHQESIDVLEDGGIYDAVIVDGSKPMTGVLTLGNGTDLSGIDLRSIVGSDPAIQFWEQNDADRNSWIGGWASGTNGALELRAYNHGTGSPDTYLILNNGKVSAYGAGAADITPTHDTHLTPKKWVDDTHYSRTYIDGNIYTQAEVDANTYTRTQADAAFEEDLGLPATNGLALVSSAAGVRSWTPLLGGGDFLADGSVDMTGNLEINKASPRIRWHDSSQALDEKRWDILSTGSKFKLRAIDDAGSTADTAIEMTRVAEAVNKVSITNPASASVQGTDIDSLTRKDYVDAQDDLQVLKTGDSMSGKLSIDMGTSDVMQLGTGGGGDQNWLTIGKGFASESGITWLTSGNDSCRISEDSNENLNFHTDYADILANSRDFVFSSNASTERARIYGDTNVTTGEVMLVQGNLGISGATEPTAAHHVTRKDYVDAIAARPNAIINGNFDVWQRGTSWVSIAASAYSADRWQYEKSGTMVHTVLQNTTTIPTYAQSGTTSRSSLQVNCTTADTSLAASDFCQIEHTLEGYDYGRIAGGDITLSFWVYATLAGTYCVAFRNSGVDRAYISEYTITTANTWEKIEITVPTTTAGSWAYATGVGLRITWSLGCSTTLQTTKDAWQVGNYLATSSQVNLCATAGNNFIISQVKIEKGSNATRFEERRRSEELALCQRYYWRGQLSSGGYGEHYGAAGSTSMTMDNISFPVTMRANPTLAIVTAPTYQNCTNVDLVGSEHGFAHRTDVTATGIFRAIDGVYEAAAEL